VNPLLHLSDDLGICTYLNAKLEFPTAPETVLHFFESIQKTYPEMTDFERRESGEYVLEEDRDEESFRSVALDKRRLISAINNPETRGIADELHERILELAPFHLDVSNLNCESLEVAYSFDFLYQGNHDEIIAEALAPNSPFEQFGQYGPAKVLHFEPSMVIALDDECRRHARLWVESRTNTYQVATGEFPETPISVYFVVNQLWGKGSPKSFVESYRAQRQIAEDLIESYIAPNVLLPLKAAIASHRL
jgi:hypothetical protein